LQREFEGGMFIADIGWKILFIEENVEDGYYSGFVIQ